MPHLATKKLLCCVSRGKQTAMRHASTSMGLCSSTGAIMRLRNSPPSCRVTSETRSDCIHAAYLIKIAAVGTSGLKHRP